jgi:N-methylhydantoinase A
MRQIRVGPESAGSEPGPACYGRGGKRPAVTDADLVLGKLDPNNFAGGSIVLNKADSEQALVNELGSKLDMDAQTAAYGLVEVVDENMANAARVHAVENGEDLDNYTMIAFGGAAPLHAGRLCEKLGVDRLLVPVGAGVGSAIGFLRAPFSFEANRSVFMRLSDFSPSTISTLLSELEDEARGFVRRCDQYADILSEYKVYMRYSGQGWEIPVMLTQEQAITPNMETFKELFETDYRALFGRVVDGMDIEITVWAVNATTPSMPVARATELSASSTASNKPSTASNKLSTASNKPGTASNHKNEANIDSTRRIFDPAMGQDQEASVVLRGEMQSGQTVSGPAAIVEDETTVIVPASREAIMQSDGCIDITVRAK